MRNLIIISGDLAAGKSTLANSLSMELNIPYITKDNLKEIACDVIGYSNREENRNLSITATESMIYFFKQIAMVGGDLIIEANFRNDEMQKIVKITEEKGYNVVLIVLFGDVNLLYQRFLDRLPDRHIAHKSLHLDKSFDDFANYVAMIRNEDLIYEPHYIDMTELDEEDVTEKALEILREELDI